MMKTIAISIDEATLGALDRLAAARSRSRRSSPARRGRSEVVRLALREYILRQEREQREARERIAISRHRDLLARQAAALVEEQGEP